MQRNSSVLDSVELAPAFSLDGTYLLPYHLMATASYRHDNKFPDVNQLKLVETGRVAFPNENLKHEVRDRATANLVWQKRDVFYGLGLRYEHANNLIKPKWAVNRGIDTGPRPYARLDHASRVPSRQLEILPGTRSKNHENKANRHPIALLQGQHPLAKQICQRQAWCKRPC